MCSLLSTENNLIIGTAGEIISYEWSSITSSKLGKPHWQVSIPSKVPVEQQDVNCLWLSEDKETLFAGCGDNNIYSFTLETVSLKLKYLGHDDFIHCIDGK